MFAESCRLFSSIVLADLILSRKPEDKIHKVFVDPTGNHTIVSCVNGLNFYINARSTKFLPLSKWKVRCCLVV
jgi:hypothetical protein